MPTHRVHDVETLAGARQAYLDAVAQGADELVVELAPGAYGVDGERPASLDLADPAAHGVPELDVTVRCAGDGIAALAGIGITVAGRSIELEGLAIVGATGGAITLAVGQAAVLRDVTVLGAAGDPQWTVATVELQAAGAGSATATLERVVVARSSAREAALQLSMVSGAWWEQARSTGSSSPTSAPTP